MADSKNVRHRKKPAARAIKEKAPPSKEIGKYVCCFQLVGEHKHAFEAKIIGERGNGYWLVEDGGQEHQVSKGACSTVPYRQKEVRTAAYREKVLAKVSSPSSQGESETVRGSAPDVREPGANGSVPTKKSRSTGRKRSGNRKDKKPTGSVGSKKKKGWGRITGNSS